MTSSKIVHREHCAARRTDLAHHGHEQSECAGGCAQFDKTTDEWGRVASQHYRNVYY